MTTEQNIKAILEAHFTGFRDDIIDYAVEKIMKNIRNIKGELCKYDNPELIICDARKQKNIHIKSELYKYYNPEMPNQIHYVQKQKAGTSTIHYDLKSIKAIVETSFAGFRDDIIEGAVEQIMIIITNLTTKTCKYYNTQLRYPRCYAQKCAPYTRCVGCKKYCEL